MDMNGRLGSGNGHGVQDGLGNVAVMGGISVKVPQAVRNGVVLYGQVPSLNDSLKLYWVKKRRLGTARFVYSCNCEASFLGNHLCKHIAAFRLAETER